MATGWVAVAGCVGLDVADAAQGRGASGSWSRNRPNAASKKMKAARPMSSSSEEGLRGII
jgi:hypothetical protein